MAAAYERGYLAGQAEASRRRWNAPAAVSAMREARQQTEISSMKARSAAGYQERGYPAGYDYRGGAVDWQTGLPEGSGCAWLRRKRHIGSGVAA